MSAFVLLASLAHADAIGMGPTDCPPGSYPNSSHCGEWCEPSTCTPSIPPPCGSGMSCESTGVCIHLDTRPGGGCGMGWEPNTPNIDYRVATKACSTDADCGEGDHCEVVDRCVEAFAIPPVVGGDGGWSCPLAVGMPILGLGLLGLAANRK